MASENKFGKVSELKIESEFRDGKTIVSDSFFTPPFKIMLPLYQKDKLTNKQVMRLLLLMASPGIMEGDVQKFQFDLKEGSDVGYFTQSRNLEPLDTLGPSIVVLDILTLRSILSFLLNFLFTFKLTLSRRYCEVYII